MKPNNTILIFAVLVILGQILTYSIFVPILRFKGIKRNYSLKDYLSYDMAKFKHKFLNVPLNRRVCAENLRIFKSCMKCIDFWLSEGTALGAFRQNDFIEHDDDVDIGMWYKDTEEFHKTVVPCLLKNGFVISREYLDGTSLTFTRKGENLDVDMVGEGIQCIAHAKNRDCNMMLPFLKNFEKVYIRGEMYNCPQLPYIEYLYGDTWNIPLKYSKGGIMSKNSLEHTQDQ